MMKNILTIIAMLFVLAALNGQAPNSFRYQAMLRDGSGTPKANVAVTVKIDILQGSITGSSVYTESHNVTTTAAGLINLDLGSGTATNGTFAAINWGSGLYFIKITVDGIVMGTSQLLSVPYALYSSNAGSVGALKKLTVAGETSVMDEALFEVKNKDGQTVFAVYNDGVRIYVSDGAKKGSKGGFAIGGFGTSKAPSQSYLVVSPDSIRAFIDDNTGKGSKGGFAIGGFSSAKGPGDEYLRVNPYNTKIYIDNPAAKGSKGGFAIGGFSGAKGESSDYMLVSPDSTNFYIRPLSPNVSSTFNILSIDENLDHKSLMKANADSIDLSSVLTLENNFNVFGNIGYTGAVNQIVAPTVTTTEPTNVAQTTASTGGNISSNGGAVVIASGVVWGTASGPTVDLTTKTTNGSASGSFTSNLSGLTANTLYYVRAYATNSAGTAYGNEFGFMTTSGGATVNDIDGNTYNTVTIGTQTWMAQNLKTNKFNDGSSILNLFDPMAWSYTSVAAFAWYANDATTYQPSAYGALYNWFSVTSGKLCPAGWHVPTDAEWQTLSDGLGGNFVAGGKLKETALAHWLTPNTGATNEVGFTALPGGLRDLNGTFSDIGNTGNWWSSSVFDTQSSFSVSMNSGTPETMNVPQTKNAGLSVRCLQGLLPQMAPTVTTTPIDTYAYTTATAGGDIVSNGGAAITSAGVCWSTDPNPTVGDNKTSDIVATGPYSSYMTGLTMGTTYYVRAYATNSVGTSYGNEVSFTTLVSK
jgi:uncharacterized protein (TIGR02145 family)